MDLNSKFDSKEKDGTPFKKSEEIILSSENIRLAERHNSNVIDELYLNNEPSKIIEKSNLIF